MHRSCTRMPAAIAALLLTLVSPHVSAQLQSEGVVFSYMSMRIGEAQQPVLIPIPAEQVRPDLPVQATIPAAFGVLRNGKPASYGSASVVASDALIAQGRVEVHLGPGADESSFQIVSAETVLTFAALGISRVVFPGWDEDGMTVDDVPFARYRFEVPLWQAVIAGRVPQGDVILPSGERVRNDTFYERLQAGDREIGEAILDILRDGERLPRYYVLQAVAGLQVDGYEAAVVPLMSDDDPAFRSAALQALLPSAEPAAWDAVVTMMTADPDPQLRERAAQALASAPIESYRVYEVFYRAEAADRATRDAAIAEMGSMDDPRVREVLAGWLRSADASLREQAGESLRSLGAWDLLVAALDAQAVPDDTKMASANALVADGSGEPRRRALAWRARATAGSAAIADIEQLASGAPRGARETYEAFLSHSDLVVARHMIGSLADLSDVDSLPALAAVSRDEARDPVTRAEARDAVEAIVFAQPASALSSLTDAEEPVVRAAAYVALGDAASRGAAPSGAFETLRGGLSSNDPVVRGASARGIARYGTDEAFELVLGLDDDPDTSVRGAAAAAIGAFDGEAFADRAVPAAVRAIESGEPEVVAGGLDALGALGARSLLALAVEKVRDRDPRVRAAAFRASAALVDPDAPHAAINAIGAGLRDESIGNRILASSLLGQFEDPLAVLTLSQVVNGPQMDVRLAAIEALGETGASDAVGTLVALLEDPERRVRLAAADALDVLGLASAIPGIESQLSRESDPETIAALQALRDSLRESGGP